MPVIAAFVRRRPVVAVVALVAGYAVVRSWVVPGVVHLPANVAFAGLILAVARVAGSSARDLGFARADLGSGFRWGSAAILAVALVVTAALALPVGGDLVDDDELDVGWGRMLVRAAIVIPVGTVLVEEVVFRAVLLGLVLRHHGVRAAVAGSSAVFGLWHLPPILWGAGDAAGATLGSGPGLVAATLVATTFAGAAFAWLRLRSGSLLAPVLAHVGTNSVTLVLVWSFAG